MIIAVDFDGTCVTHEYPEIGREVEGCVDILKKLNEKGHKLILWTMRDGDTLAEASKWLTDKGVSLWGINNNPEWGTGSPKAYANIYIDDAALGCPLIYPKVGRPYVDWSGVEGLLMEKGIIL